MPQITIGFTAGPLQLQASRGLFSVEPPGTNFVKQGSSSGPLSISTASLSNAVVGQSYSMTLSASGGVSPYNWNIVSATPNTDLWLRCANSALYGIPQLNETETVVLQVTDSTPGTPLTAQATFTLTVTVTGVLAVATPTGQSVSSYYQGYGSVAGAVFSLKMLAQGGQPPYLWAFSGPNSIATGSTTGSSYSLPFSGWLQSPSTGSGIDVLTALCTDSAGASFTQTVNVNVHPTALYFYPLDTTHTVPTINLPPAFAGTPYSTQLRVGGGSGSNQVYAISSGSLPSGLSMSSTGLINGVPFASGNINNFQIQCTDSANNVATAFVYLNVSSQNKSARPAYNTGSGFFVDANGVFRDPNGSAYQFRGLNKLHFDSSSWANNTNGALANPGIVRAWVFDNQTAAFAANQVSTQYQPNNILTLLTLAGISTLSPTGTTGQTNTAYITQSTADFQSYFSTLSPVMNTIAINLANEWGPANSTSWRDTYITAVQALRTTGYTCPIFIDTGGSGQDPYDITTYAAAIQAADPQHNCVFCYHSYGNTLPYQCNINNITTGSSTTIVTLNSALPYHPFNPGNPANGAYSGLNGFIITGAQGMTSLNGTFTSPTNTFGSAGAWQLHLNVNSTGWTGSYVPNSATVTTYSTPATGAGGWDYRKLYSDFAALKSSGVCVAIMEFGPANQLGNPALNSDGRNPGPSHTNTTIGQVIWSAEAAGLPWCYWAWDDHGGGGGSPPSPVDGFWGWFADTLGNVGIYGTPTNFTAAGLESVANPRYGLWALSQAAPFFLPSIFELTDQAGTVLIDQGTTILTG